MTPRECKSTIDQVELMQKLPMRQVPSSARWRIAEVDGKQTRDEIRLKKKFNSYAGVAELADAPDLGSGGKPWEFKSLRPHHLYKHGTLFVPCLFCSKTKPNQSSLHSISLEETTLPEKLFTE